jgi:ferredoxin-type protein NapG
MDSERRQFLRRAFAKTGEQIVKQIDDKVVRKAANYIRPPYAIPEMEFLLACTRCNACIEACPHQVIFPLSNRLGTEVLATPAMSLANKACMLCEGYPCVSACEPKALYIDVEAEEAAPPKIANIAIDESTCLPFQGPECGACVSACPIPGAMRLDMEKPVIEPQLCVGCGQCRVACITEPKSINISSVYATDEV